jgi:hypothetical protein
MLGLDLEKAGKEAVEEVAEKIVPLLEPILDAAIAKLGAELEYILVGRKININITIG